MTALKSDLITPDPTVTLESLVGHCEWIEQLRSVIQAVAPYSSSVLITGPSGTGKELIARAIHQLSPRARCRFIPVDCASITGPLFASHMFGHLKGSFTGATYNAVGCFRAADGGTIFLDEIGELDLELQAKLLRVLQERVVTPVGSHDGAPVDVRVIAASNRDLQIEVAAGRFREDLYFRLNVVSVETRSLRERGEDIELLAEHILRRLAAENGMPLKHLSEGARRQLRVYDWPGNIRELENAIERAILFSPGDAIDAQLLPGASGEEEVATIGFEKAVADMAAANGGSQPTIAMHNADGIDSDGGRWPTAADVEREHIIRTLDHARQNQSAAARLLDIDRHQLRRRMQEYGLMQPGQARRGRPALPTSIPRKKAA
jgi:DNA-binding NtrC family response regulator